MSTSPRTQAINYVAFPNGEIAVSWADGHESYYPAHLLRCACACAHCVDEMSGRKTLRDEDVSQDVRPLEIHPVGRYAIAIKWSDGHDTGIYSFDQLRRLCPSESSPSESSPSESSRE